MSPLITTLKALVLIACVSVLPFWLIIEQGAPVLWSVGGSVVLCIFLAAIWTQGGAK
jgi:hypothetical protein